MLLLLGSGINHSHRSTALSGKLNMAVSMLPLNMAQTSLQNSVQTLYQINQQITSAMLKMLVRLAICETKNGHIYNLSCEGKYGDSVKCYYGWPLRI